jgi:hypothetical protein
MKLDAACGKHMRTVKQYEEDRATVTLAVEIVRQKVGAEIDQVIRFMHARARGSHGTERYRAHPSRFRPRFPTELQPWLRRKHPE